MNHLNVSFCEVCSEQLTKSIYQRLKIVDGCTPPATNVLRLYTGQPVAFSVQPLQPATHSLSLQWYSNTVPVPDATNSAFTLQPQVAANGNLTLEARARDLTSLVRNDPTRLLSNSVIWNLNLSLSELALVAPQVLPGNRFSMVVTGSAPSGFVLQGSSNLVTWTRLWTNTLSGGRYNYTNSDPAALVLRFYRAMAPP